MKTTGVYGPVSGAFSVALAGMAAAASMAVPAIEPITPLPAVCGAGALPETGMQGQVPLADRLGGRSAQGYRCNLELLGQYQGQGASWVNPSLDHCAYLATSRLGRARNPSPGVQVIDVSNPAAPRLATTLIGPAMRAGTWESLKINEKRKLLGGVAGGYLIGVGSFDVYDLAGDCARPRHLNGSKRVDAGRPDNWLGHEGNWSPDGLTYWSAGLIGGSLTAIDVTNPSRPQIIYVGHAGGPVNHGMAFNTDGTRLYMSSQSPSGLVIYDVGDIQRRAARPTITQLGSISWDGFGGTQHMIPVSYAGRPYVITPSESFAEGIHFVDISDEAHPTVVSQVLLPVQLPANRALYVEDNADSGFFGYEAHYCSVDREQDPTALACGYFQSGVRVFDIRNPRAVREIAYFNPPAQTGKASVLPGSEHAAGWGQLPLLTVKKPADGSSTEGGAGGSGVPKDLYADWCSSPPRFVGDQLWVTCQDNGFMVLKFSNGAYPLQ